MFTLNPIGNGHISIVEPAPHKRAIYGRDNARGVPPYNLWREPLMKFSSQLASVSSNNSESGPEGIHRTVEEETLKGPDKMLYRRTWYQGHKNDNDTCVPPWQNSPSASDFNFISPSFKGGNFSATSNYTSLLSASCNGPRHTAYRHFFAPFMLSTARLTTM